MRLQTVYPFIDMLIEQITIIEQLSYKNEHIKLDGG